VYSKDIMTKKLTYEEKKRLDNFVHALYQPKSKKRKIKPVPENDKK
jgi:hypothetical protein